MNKKLLLLMASISFACAYSSQYIVIADGEYNIKNFTDHQAITDWSLISSDNCTFKYNNSDFYYNFEYEQIETCDNSYSRNVTITRNYEDGTTRTIKSYEENKIESEDSYSTEIGTHTENTCKDIIDNGYSSGDGLYYLDNGGLTQAYCDMTTNGGGWTAVWKNYGGINATGINTLSLLNSSTSSTVIPKEHGGVLESAKNGSLQNYYFDKTGIEILKTTRGFLLSDGSETSLTSNYDNVIPNNILLDLGENVKYNTIYKATENTYVNNKIKMYYNGSFYGESNLIYFFNNSKSSIGFPNKQNSEDIQGQPDNNLMNGWLARHIFMYSDNDGRDAVRCQPTCWIGDENYQIETVWYYR